MAPLEERTRAFRDGHHTGQGQGLAHRTTMSSFTYTMGALVQLSSLPGRLELLKEIALRAGIGQFAAIQRSPGLGLGAGHGGRPRDEQ